MPNPLNYLAIDLGAESGRTIVGSLTGNQLSLTETHRFANTPVSAAGSLHWDVLNIWQEIKTGIGISSERFSKTLVSVGLDAWGVDYALLDRSGALLGNPYHYRDNRTEGMLDEAFNRMPAAEIYAHTGCQFMQINTLYQLLAASIRQPFLFDAASRLVMIPDLFNFWLSGEITNEFTVATTTQCYNPRQKDWVGDVLKAMQIPNHIFGSVIQSGASIGPLAARVSEETAAGNAQVILPACHDTGSAVVAVPAANPDFAWISSGTWSIMGAEVSEPLINDQTFAYNFTNEGGVFGTWRLSKNIMGLWLVQECRREWVRQGEELSYVELAKLASEAEPFMSVIDPDFERFLAPGDMPLRIQQFCAESGQTVPQSKGQIIRIALEGIALKYRLILERLEEITGKRLGVIHIFGGGIKNRLLNQFIADATQRTVIAGPVEATAIGNILVQAISLNHIGSLAEGRAIVQSSFTPEAYEPQQNAGWDTAYSVLRKVIK